MNGAVWPVMGRAFRRAAPPLAWYYAITLVLPIAHGAALAGAAFGEHALVVLVLPPALIVFACASREGVRMLATRARACWRRPSRQAPS
jgi:hypothetical protein